MSTREAVVSSQPIFNALPLARILAGQRHAPVVYFAHIGLVQGGEVVKIGTTINLQARMRDLYVPIGNVLALVPGDRDVETGYHRLFAEYQVNHRMREMFRLEGRLKRFLGSQTEGTADDLPPRVPALIQSAARRAQEVMAAPVAPEIDRAGLMSLKGIADGALVSCSVQALRQDRYRSDKGELPAGLRFPEPATKDGQAELFVISQIQDFDIQRRGAGLDARRAKKERAA